MSSNSSDLGGEFSFDEVFEDDNPEEVTPPSPAPAASGYDSDQTSTLSDTGATDGSVSSSDKEEEMIGSESAQSEAIPIPGPESSALPSPEGSLGDSYR